MVTRMPPGTQPHKSANGQLPAIVQTGALAALEDSAKQIIIRHMRPFALKAGQFAFRAGDEASNYLVVKSGAFKVSVTSESGREIVLYRVEPGQTCVLTTSCLLAGSKYEAEAVADEDTEAVILPRLAFDELMATSDRFRQFVFSSYGERLHTLIGLVQEVTIKHVDRRLARLLLLKADGGVVATTHQVLAQELNSAREVVTRLLNDFAEKGWLRTARGKITLTDEAALDVLAATV